MPPAVHVAIYRIAQEALNNVAKHSRARSAQVSLDCSGGEDEVRAWAMLRVCDDGCGFDPATVSPESLGLDIMRERASGIGAVLAVETQTGCGTAVTVTWEDR